jgi:O-glycosyl hydrolase
MGGTAAGGRPQVTAAPGATLVRINANVRYQKFEGWGTSLCWWANRIGGWATDKKNQFLDRIVNPATGLGYNIFRYNIGGGENPAHSHMGQYKDMPGLQPTQGSWNWNADSRQTSVLSRLVASGQNVIVEAFSNSPPYWMTKSGCASGNTDGSNNLKDDSYDAFANYLTEVVKHYRDELGITFRSLEPMNEPNANWWKSDGGQEGCHFAASNQQQIIKAVGAQLATKGLTGTGVSASDENSMDDAYNIMSGYDSTTLGYLVQMNAHSYAGTRRTQLRALATSKGKRLWQSESGPLNVTLANNTDAAIFMAGRIITDLRELQPEAWIDWQVVDVSTNWTSFNINDTQQTGTPVKRFYMHAGFSRYIRPGATFVDISNTNMVAAVAGDGSYLTVVVRNGDTAATASFTYDLTALPSVGTNIEVYRTSASEDLVHLSSISIQNWSFTATSTPYSVTTYVIPLAG